MARAAATFAPAEIPARRPSSRASRSAVAIASSSFTCTISSITERLRIPGTKDAPIPWIPWTRAFPPESTGDLAGSTATMRTPGIRWRSTSPTPVIVPPVRPASRTSTYPAGGLQDLERRRPSVRLRVRRVLELAELHGSREVLSSGCARATASFMSPRGSARRRRRGTEERALTRHSLGHGEVQPVAADRRDEREGDARVSARGLDQRRAGPEHAPSFGVFNHGTRSGPSRCRRDYRTQADRDAPLQASSQPKRDRRSPTDGR